MSVGRRIEVLITGASGRVGTVLAGDLADQFSLRFFDRIGSANAPGWHIGDLNDADALDVAMAGVDVVIHLAADARPDAPYERVRSANIDGTYAVYEAARRNGVGRVIFASSNRAVEMASRLRAGALDSNSPELSTATPTRPDSLYGVSKVFGEALGSYYADVHGLTSIILRLGSVDVGERPCVADKPRAWALWLSRRDLIAVFGAAVTAPVTGHVVLYACSANTRRWWDLETTRRMLNVALNDDSERLLHDRHVGSLTPPAPRYALPWGERLAALAPAPGRSFLVALGQSGFLIRTSASSTAIDPFLTDWPDRLQPSLLAAEDLAVDHILITHTHRDHLDAAALPIIAARRPDTVFVGPPTVVTRLIELGVDAARIITLLPSQSIELRDITVTAVPARHKPTTPDAQGYVVRVDGATIYHTGDTEHDECLQTAIAKRPDVLLVPINGRKGNMGPEHAALLARHSDVGVVIPMHYGCLQPTADLLDRFTAELERLGTNARIAVMDPGTIAYVPFRS